MCFSLSVQYVARTLAVTSGNISHYAVNILGHVDIRVTQNVPTPSGLAPSRSVWLLRKLRKYSLLPNRPSVNQFKGGLGIFAGKLDCGCPGTTSAIDLFMLASTGVARKAWISPA